MFGRKHNSDTTTTDQRIAQIHYKESVSDMANFKLASGKGPTPRQVQEVVARGRAAGIPAGQLARDADAMRAWGQHN